MLALDRLPVEDVAALKMAHLERHVAYDVLVLGNSRPLPLRVTDLDMEPRSFFNASLTGESLRSSILLLERLAEVGRLPRVALISFDHAELNYYGNPQWPPLGIRWGQLASDLWAGWMRPTISGRELARMTSRHLANEAAILARKFNFVRVMRGLGAWRQTLIGGDDGLAPPAVDGQGYLADGSRPPAPADKPFTGQALATPNRNILPGYLDYDLERLAALKRAGAQIVVYETLLYPEMHRKAMAQPSTIAAESRSSFTSLCARHGLECHQAPPDFDGRGLPWADAGHPPASVLAAWIMTFVHEPKAQR